MQPRQPRGLARGRSERWQMAQDEHFRNFNAVAHARNTAGTPCRKPLHCAAQPSASHMWHHEDAGIGCDVFLP